MRMDNSHRDVSLENARQAQNEALHVDAHSREFRLPTINSRTENSLDSSVIGNVSMFSSRNSEADIGQAEEVDGVRTVILHKGVDDMLRDVEIRNRYPAFYKFLTDEDPSWYEPAPLHGTFYRIPNKTTEPDDIRSKNELKYEMLDLMHRFYRQRHVNSSTKRETDELKHENCQLRAAAVKAKQEEESISSYFIDKLFESKNTLEQIQKDYESTQHEVFKEYLQNVGQIAEENKNRCYSEDHDNSLQARCQREQNRSIYLQKYNQEVKEAREYAVAQDQVHFIETLAKRISVTNEENRKMQAALEQAYLNGFVDYDSGVRCAIRAIAAEKFGTVTSPSPTLRQSAPSPMGGAAFAAVQLTDQGQLYEETQRLTGMVKRLHKKNAAHRNREKELTEEVSKLQQTIDMIRQETRNFEMGLNSRINVFCNKILGDEVRSNTNTQGASTSTPVQPIQSIVHPMPSQAPPTAFATAYPMQRSPGSRHGMNTM